MGERIFGKTPRGKLTHLYSLENDYYRITMSDYGATLVSMIDKKTGIDIVLGYNSVDGYLKTCPYMGATVGRVCNRIGKGSFKLNDKTYHLMTNDRGNTLHGGLVGFASKIWVPEIKETALIFTLESPDGDEGFPGKVEVKAKYELINDKLIFTWSGISDQDTLLSLTNHAYFNLAGPRSLSVLDQELKINSEQIVDVDENGLAEETTSEVKDTPFDFRKYKKIGKDLNKENPQLKNGQGYDHHFIISGTGLREAARLKGNGLELIVSTDLPGLQLYSANFLEGNSLGKEGGIFPKHSAVCLETQYVPNAINYEKYDKPILLKGKEMIHQTIYQVAHYE